uniref:Mitochondrial transcription factor A, putative n=1 Tax=Riptortus pedestris TaxID=329032 RepID=R4WRI6_RIPPE|nr:mitochondrial transcription factor A, putative [Riptortus pedestris]
MTVFQNVIARLSNNSYIANYRCSLVNRISTSVYQYTPKQSVEEKLGIEPRPKRPSTPFITFVSQHRPIITQQNPHASPQEIVKLLTEEWKKLDESVKVKLKTDFKKDWQDYINKCTEYDNLLSPHDRENIEKAKEEAQYVKEKRLLKKQMKDLGCPKRPGSSYLYFMKSKLPERGDTPFLEFQKKVKEDWKKLPELQKGRFEQLYHKDMDEYRQKMTLWTKKMEEEGKFMLTKKGKESDGPKKPGSSFIYFMKSRLLDRGETPYKEFQLKLREEWANMPDSQKKKFEELRNKEMEEYKVKIGGSGSRKERNARVRVQES